MMEIVILLLAPAVAPPVADLTTTRAQQENLTTWPSRFPVELPQAAPRTLLGLTVPPAVFGKARQGLDDLRLVDSAGNSVQYVLRVRSPRVEPAALPGKVFNPVIRADGSLECSIDLGEGVGEHNEVAIPLAGSIYHRAIRIDGSDDGKTWNKLLDDVYMVHLEVEKETIDHRRFSYPPSRYRYLRVSVGEDVKRPAARPRLDSFTVLRSVHLPGVIDEQPAQLKRTDPGRYQGSYATAYLIDLPDDRVPVSELLMDVSEREFNRPFTLESAVGDGPWEFVANGTLEPRPDGKSLEIRFEERVARRLRLQVLDSSNTPLTIGNPRFRAARRELLFRLPAETKLPLYLYAGSASAIAPRYDFGAGLSLQTNAETTASVGVAEPNPTYLAPPVPWSERHPRLIDGVLTGAALVLAGILFVLAKTAIRRHDVVAA